jgi:RNA polymerase sigma-70 factor, ECF subfamily
MGTAADLLASIDKIQRVVDAVLRRRLGADDPERDDLRQEVIETVLDAIARGRFRGDCSVTKWAAVISRNIAADALRARYRSRKVFADDETAGSDGNEVDVMDNHRPDVLLEIRSDLNRVDSAMAKMGPAHARVVYLHDALGHSLEEIAKMLGISVGAAQSRLVRARRHINELLGNP